MDSHSHRAKTAERKAAGAGKGVAVTGEMLLAALAALKQQNAVLADHPHAAAYQALQVCTAPQLP